MTAEKIGRAMPNRGSGQLRLSVAVCSLAVSAALSGCAAKIATMQEDFTRRQGVITTGTDEFRDVRGWALGPMNVSGTYLPSTRDTANYTELRMGATASVAGPRNPDKPGNAELYLKFWSRSTDWRYMDRRRTVDFIVDGATLNLGEASHEGDIQTARDVVVIETMYVPVSREQLARIANGTDVRGQFAVTRFQLKPVHLEQMRAFLERLPPTIR